LEIRGVGVGEVRGMGDDGVDLVMMGVSDPCSFGDDDHDAGAHGRG
jgi:hypothetical protein